MNVWYSLQTGHAGGLCFGSRTHPLVPSCSRFVLQTFPRRPSVFDVQLPDIRDRKLNYSPRHDQIIAPDRKPSPSLPLLVLLMGTDLLPAAILPEQLFVYFLCCAVFYLFCILMSIYYIFTDRCESRRPSGG